MTSAFQWVTVCDFQQDMNTDFDSAFTTEVWLRSPNVSSHLCVSVLLLH